MFGNVFLQNDFALVDVVPVVLEVLLDVADVCVLVLQFVFEVFLCLQQGVVVRFQPGDSLVHVRHCLVVFLGQRIQVGVQSTLVGLQVEQVLVQTFVVTDQ